MKARIEDTCVGCELCVDICPEVFEMGDEYAEIIADPVPAEQEELTQKAADDCPVDAIIIE